MTFRRRGAEGSEAGVPRGRRESGQNPFDDRFRGALHTIWHRVDARMREVRGGLSVAARFKVRSETAVLAVQFGRRDDSGPRLQTESSQWRCVWKSTSRLRS